MNVYIITHGCYSDYGIERCFSTREKAEEFISESANDQDGYSYRIEEYRLDIDDGLRPRPRYTAWIYLDNGDIDIYDHVIVKMSDGSDESQQSRDYKTMRETLCVRSSVSKEHVAKLAAEKRQEWLRNQAQGIPQ